MFSLLSVKKVFNNSVQQHFKAILKNASFVASNVKTTADGRYVTVDVRKDKHHATTLTSTTQNHKYPLIWLRDSCQCPECFHAQSMSRTIDWTKFDFKNAQPKSISADKQLQITWQDDHVSKFDWEWLCDRSFNADNRKKYIDGHYRPKPKLWSKTQFVIKEFQAESVFNTDAGLYEWLETLSRYGVAMIKNAPLDERQCRRMCDRVGFIRETHYGKEYAVRADPNAKNIAYTSEPLQFHTDLPYYDYVPGVTLLHCISQTNSPGAFNSLADGFYVAERLKLENPKAFECLTTTLVNWCDYGDSAGVKFEKIYRNPLICLDYEGNVHRINHSIPQRDTFFSVDVEKVDEWYKSLKAFIDMLHEEAVYFKTKPGDILAFSNIRLLHGRTGYTDHEGNIRHLVGAYIDWDEIYSRLRVLANDKRTRGSKSSE